MVVVYRLGMRIRRGGAILLVLLASCAQAGANPSTNTAEVTSAPATAPSVSPSTTGQKTAAPPAQTATPRSTSAQIAQPTTTTTAFVSTEQRIAQIVVEHGRQQIACFSAPTKCDVAAITAEQGTLRATMTKGIQSLIEHHYEAREDPNDRLYNNVIRVDLAEDQESAVVAACVWDPVPVWQREGAPDGSDVLVNTVKGTIHRTYRVFLENGTWLVGQLDKVDDIRGVNQCGSPA